MTQDKRRPATPGTKGLYYRGDRIWLRYKDADGAWRSRSSGFDRGQEAHAAELLRAYLDRIHGVEPAPAAGGGGGGGVSVADYAQPWQLRRRREIRAARQDDWALRLYILPHIGTLPLAEVRPRHAREVVQGAKAAGLAAKSVRNVYGVMQALFRDAEADELVLRTPCRLRRGELPAPVDADPLWRATAVFEPEEASLLCMDPRIGQDRRLLHALQVLGGLRPGEAVALRWADIADDATPLGRLTVCRARKGPTKTARPRNVPVHEQLAQWLHLWRQRGFVELLGRPPRADDLVVPSPGSRRTAAGAMRPYTSVRVAWLEDLQRLGMRQRRQHDMRRTFTSLARAAGARADVIDAVTHDRRGSIVDVYTTWPWETLCEAVSALQLRPTAVMQLLSLRTDSLQSRYSRPETSMISGPYKAPAVGLEPTT